MQLLTQSPLRLSPQSPSILVLCCLHHGSSWGRIRWCNTSQPASQPGSASSEEGSRCLTSTVCSYGKRCLLLPWEHVRAASSPFLSLAWGEGVDCAEGPEAPQPGSSLESKAFLKAKGLDLVSGLSHRFPWTTLWPAAPILYLLLPDDWLFEAGCQENPCTGGGEGPDLCYGKLMGVTPTALPRSHPGAIL